MDSKSAAGHKGIYLCWNPAVGKYPRFGSPNIKSNWASMNQLCIDKDMRLPTFEEVCQGGKGSMPKGGQYDHSDMWSPIMPQSNGNKWIQIGKRSGGTCNPLSTYHGSKGGWMETLNAAGHKGAYICFDQTKGPIPRYGHPNDKMKYETMSAGCASRGMRLPTYEEICPNGKGKAPVGGQYPWSDMWSPIQPQKNGNKWIQIGKRAGGMCNVLSTYHGSSGSWMESGSGAHHKGVYACIKPQGN